MKSLLAKLWALGLGKPKHRAYYEEMLPRFPYDADAPISKEIHQTYHKRELPKELEENVAKLKAQNPEYEYELWDDADIEDFICTYYGVRVLGYYRRIAEDYGAARADFFRYLLIYCKGGVYLDIKSSLDVPLSQVLSEQDRAVLAHWDNGSGALHEGFGKTHCKIEGLDRGEYIQWMLMYQPAHPFLREVIIDILMAIDRYNPFIHNIAQVGVLNLTGPVRYTEVIYNMIKANSSSYEYRISDEAKLGLCYSIYERLGTGATHKNVIKKNYKSLLEPIIHSRYCVLTYLAKLYYRLASRALIFLGKNYKED